MNNFDCLVLLIYDLAIDETYYLGSSGFLVGSPLGQCFWKMTEDLLFRDTFNDIFKIQAI